MRSCCRGFGFPNNMKKMLKGNVSWVGKTDWELRHFHGHELSTHRGSSYNSYLIQEEKTVLIDTVWSPFSAEFISNLEAELGSLDKIDFVIANHAEMDHSGALLRLMEKIPGKPVYCTANGVKSLRGHYHASWNLQPVKSGDKLDIGNGKSLIFIEAPMLHWPDSMFTYLTGDNILFSNDAFGQHLASEDLFNDLVDQDELIVEALKYYANILTPFSPLVLAKIAELKNSGLPVDIIAPSHGIIWRNDPLQIVERYAKWADSYQENQITIIYDTMWGGTRRMAEAIGQGVREASPQTEVKIFNVGEADRNDVIVEIFKSKAVAVGSPTINNGILTAVAAILEEIKGLKFKNKKWHAFGTYGWSGEGADMINKRFEESGFASTAKPLKAMWNPDLPAIEAAHEFGRSICITPSP